MSDSTHTCQLYVISPESIELESFKVQLQEVLATGEVAVFQLRLKNIPDKEIIEAVEALMPICHKYSVQFILNDRPDLAAKVNADGVHIGEEQDGSYEDARDLVGADKIVGISCYGSIDRALDVAEKGVDYVAFGAFYPTTTKEPKARPKVEVLEWWARNSVVPCVAIGGINVKNCAPIVRSGADFIAVVSAIWSASKGVESATRELVEAIKIV